MQASLKRGDRILLFSDGVVGGRAEGGEFFGTDRLVDLLGGRSRTGSRRRGGCAVSPWPSWTTSKGDSR